MLKQNVCRIFWQAEHPRERHGLGSRASSELYSPRTPSPAAPGPPFSLSEVEERDPVADGAEQRVAIAGEAEVAAAVHGAQQAGELRGQEGAALEGLGIGGNEGEMRGT